MPICTGFICHVRGNCGQYNNKPIVCTEKQFRQFEKDRKAYNKKFSREN